MGRPLRKDTIDAMKLKVESGETLSKQVGYNKYRTLEDEERIVRLAEVAADDDVVLVLHDGMDDYPVLKITKHFFFTSKDAYAYTLDDEGKVDFGSTRISVYSDPTPTFKIVATPADATVVINGEERSEITVEAGELISWEVSAANYVTQSATDVEVTEPHTENVALAKVQHTLTITAAPEGAVVTIDGEEVASKTADFDAELAWEVSLEGYVTQNGSEVMSEDKTLEITLVEETNEPAEEQPGE